MTVRMEPRFRADFERLLAEQDLTDLDGLMTYPGYFDELPLYSSYDQLAFLDDLTVPERNRVLVRAGAAHLGTILEHARHYYAGRPFDYHCELSVTEWDEFEEGGLITPRFLYLNPSRGYFKHAQYTPPTSPYSDFVATCLDHDPDYTLSEELATDPNAHPWVRRVCAQQKTPTTSQPSLA